MVDKIDRYVGLQTFIVFFWNHYAYSAGVHVRCEVKDFSAMMRTFLKEPDRYAGLSVTHLAALLTHRCVEKAYDVEIVNAPLGVSVGATLNRICSPEQAKDGASILLIDISGDEIMQYGGPCLGYELDWNDFQPRTLPLQAVQMTPYQWRKHVEKEADKVMRREKAALDGGD